jgi:large subunit ribosomal protein L4
MLVDVLNMEGKKVSTVELPSDVFEAPVSINLMHQAYVRQMANARLGTHDTKVKSEVSGGGRKPWRQKGTGRARQGSIRSTQWKGGGKVHTPHPRDYTQAMPRKMRRAALRSALTAKAQDLSIVVIDELKIAEPKTRLMAAAMKTLVGHSSALILIPVKTPDMEGVARSARNLPDVKTILVNYLNIRDLMTFDKLIIPMTSLDMITVNLG